MLNSRKNFSPTPAAWLRAICSGVSARLWIASSLSLPEPGAIAGDLVAEHQGKAVIPVDQATAGQRIKIPGELAVDVDTPAIDRVKADYDMLLGGL